MALFLRVVVLGKAGNKGGCFVGFVVLVGRGIRKMIRFTRFSRWK